MTSPPPTAAPVFELAGVEVVRGERRVLHALDLEVGPGLTVLAGPSGAGKSTLLRLCNRLDAPSAGRIRYRGRDLATIDPLELRRMVAMVFQRPVIFPGTVRDNLLAARPARPSLVAESLDAADLAESYLTRTADDLSGGEQQRVCLARALCTEPDVVLLDEPTSSLDPRATKAIEHQTRMLVDAGHPIVWVSHQLDQLRRIADEVVLLDAGHLVAQGPPQELDDTITTTLEET